MKRVENYLQVWQVCFGKFTIDLLDKGSKYSEPKSINWKHNTLLYIDLKFLWIPSMIVSDNGKNVKERTYVLFPNARVNAVR